MNKEKQLFLIRAVSSVLLALGVIVPVFAATTPVKKPVTPATKTTSSAPILISDEQQLENIIKQSLPSVVGVVGVIKLDDGTIQPSSWGTGFVVDASGLILTNRHVVEAADPRTTFRVYLPDGRRYDAVVAAKDPLEDLAIVKISAERLPVLKLGNSDAIVIGQTAIAIGNTLGRYPNSVTKGIVSGIGRSVSAGNNATGQTETLDDVIQTDAQISPGNSGGPLLNSKGEVIGINAAIDEQGRGVGFSIPINEAKKSLDSFNKNGHIVRPYLGLRYVTITPDLKDTQGLPYDYGALITTGTSDPGTVAIVPGGPAEVAGLRDGDIILSVNDKLIRGANTLFEAIQQYNVGDTVRLKVARAGGVLDVSLRLLEVPAQ